MAPPPQPDRSSPNRSSGCLIEPQRVAEGFLFVDSDDAFSWSTFLFGCLGLLIWCGVSFPMFGAAVLGVLADPGPGTLLALFFIGIFVAFGIIGIALGIRWLIVIWRLKPGEVVLSSYPLRLGESCRIRYRRQLRWGSVPQPGQITAQWLCYEWVQYRQGTDTETRTHTLWETTLSDGSVLTGTTAIEWDTQVTVLPQGPPSLDVAHNQVRWELQIKVDLPGVAKDTSYFRFRVMPEVMR